MAKAVKTATVALPSLAADKATIARDFSTFGKFTFNNDVRDAIARRCTDKKTFNEIRIAALAAWLETDRGYDAASALANVDGTLANPAAFGKGAKRTAENQKDYKDASNAWNYFLQCSHIESLNVRKKGAKATRKPAMTGTKATPVSETLDKAPPASLSAVVPVKGDMTVTVEQFANCAALMSRIANTNAKALQGDKGAALRALAAHVQTEMKRIGAMD